MSARVKPNPRRSVNRQQNDSSFERSVFVHQKAQLAQRTATENTTGVFVPGQLLRSCAFLWQSTFATELPQTDLTAECFNNLR